MKCKLFFLLLFISISISAQNNIEINLSKKQLKEIKKIEKFKLMGLNNYGIDINAKDWVSALRYYLIGKTVSNNNGIPILVPVSTFGNKYLIQGKNVSGSPIRNYENTNVDFREPLWVIDGVPIGNAAPEGVQSLSRNIISVNVLKHSKATKYGSRGAFGVIEIITK
tara:strand:+ start:897 stop:1397 length:501 start_codon:yes stop_codon:yes gene_type:complete